ncbi:MAG TPA: flagellin FliC, partial [Porticoccus sp.]|nr:flagellin FliC [Porticoccus sp.]
MSVINTNITAMIGQQNLSRSASALSTAMERLSSGLRINSAKDDAAGLAIANRMSTQISGLMQAQRNANDGISISQTAEGALNQVNENLQRIRELTVQAANDTNSDTDLSTIQNEITQRLEEIDRISTETSFNGLQVLASDQGFKIQVGANDGQTITMELKEMSVAKLGLNSFDVSKTFLATDLAATESTETIPASLNISAASFNDTAVAATYDIYVEDANPSNII